MDYIIYAGIELLLLAGVSSVTYILVSSHIKKKAAPVGPPPIDPAEFDRLSVSREELKKLYEEAPVPYFILDQRGEVTDLNKAGLRFFGAMPENMVGKNLFGFVAEEDATYGGYLMTCCARGIPIDKKELRLVAKNAEIRWIELSVLSIGAPGASEHSSLATLFDITEQKNLDRAKTEFVSLASHQLRTPLVTVKWYAEMIALPSSGELNPKQKDCVKVIGQVNADMIDLVDTLLNVSRMEIGKLTVELGPTNVQEITESILVELSSQIAKKQMNIVKEYGGLLTKASSDPKLLRIVIHNLITNAIKYTPDAGTITIAFKESPAAGAGQLGQGQNQIVVSDTGYGIPKDQQGKIFTKLFRAENVKEISSSQSTGLGLYLVKSMVEAMGGTISFVSEENKGTSFMVTF